MVYDRISGDSIAAKIVNSRYKITSLKYGPYDNGHVIAGLADGSILVYNSADLTKLY